MSIDLLDSDTDDPPVRPPGDYQGPDRFTEWTKDYLGIVPSDAQRKIGRSVAEYQKTLVIGANGFGKTYEVACFSLAWLFTNYPSVVFATSGTYGKLKRTLCRPLEKLHRTAKRERHIPGEYTDRPPRISVEGHPEWFFEASRPRDAGELEGTHSDHLLAVIEEVDKDAVTSDVIDSMESLLTDERDRIIAIGNPPTDEANVAYDLMEDDAWNTLQFSSFESHNIQHGLDLGDDGYIDGLTTLEQVRQDWEAWNREPWPGTDAARTAHHDRTDLDERWYRRRAGVIPPATAQVYRPYQPGEVDAAIVDTPPIRYRQRPDIDPIACALDVARRGGDWNVLAARYDDPEPHIHIHERWRGIDHTGNEAMMKRYLRQWDDPPCAVDAQGEGSALADMLGKEFDIRRFNAGSKASQVGKFYDKWAEANYALGLFLRDGGTVGGNGPAGEELAAAARTLSFEERHYDSRRATVLKLTSKDEVRDRLGRSPDVLDAVLMACWQAAPETGERDARRLTW